MNLIEETDFEPENSDDINCSMCSFFEPRTAFCRRFPPQTINSGKHEDMNTGYVTTFAKAVFPVITRPMVDYCGEFNRKTDK